MSTNKYSRRAFINRQAIKGIGLLAGGSVLSSMETDFASPQTGNLPFSAVGNPIRAGKSWPQWPMWQPETDGQLVNEVLKSGVWSRSKTVTAFEEKWAATVGAKKCVTAVSGTQALTIAIAQLGIGIGDEVLVPPYTFIASVVAILNNGAMPVFVDTDRETFQIDVSKIEAKITKRTKAIMPVHVLGLPADIEAIMRIANKHKLLVIEDACQAPLAEVNGKQVGTFGNAGCYSFQNSKNLPIGEGGAIVSNDEHFIDKCYSYHNFGYPYASVSGSGGAIRMGTKLRWTEYQAAIGLAQMNRFQEQTSHRNENAVYLQSKLSSIPGITPYKLTPNVTRPTFHLFAFRYNPAAFGGMSRTDFIKALNAEGIPAQSGYIPLNTQPYIQDYLQSPLFKKVYPNKMLDIKKYNERNACPENDLLCEEAIWLFHNVLLGDRSDMDDIADAIEKVKVNRK